MKKITKSAEKTSKPTTIPQVKEMRISKSVSETWTMKVGYDYAIITINEKIGSFSVQSSYIDGSHIWTAIGNKSLKEFVCGLDFDYMMGKLIGRGDYFYIDKTIESYKQHIIQERLGQSLSKDEARFYWEIVQCWDDDDDDYMNCNDFYDRCLRNMSDVVDHICSDDTFRTKSASIKMREQAYEVLDHYHFVTGHSPSAKMFWEKIWEPFVIELKKEIKENECA